MKLEKLKTLLIDGDGVLWHSTEPVPGLGRFFDVLDRRGINWALLTNNNTQTVDTYVNKLRGFDIEADPSMVFTSSTVTADYLMRRYGKGAPLYVIGMAGLIDTLKAAGFDVHHGDSPPPCEVVAVAAGMDRQLTFEMVKIAMRLIFGGAEFVATNTDGSYPTPEGIVPGTGMVIGALRGTACVEPTVLGKPEPAMYEAAIQHFNADRETTAMIGDRLETDILGAQRAGIGSIAVLTGITNPEQLATSDIQPDHVFDSIKELSDALLAP